MIKMKLITSIVTVFLLGCAAEKPPFFTGPADFYADTGVVHTVALGENMNTIAQSYDVSVDYIVNANALPFDYRLRVGQKLQIPNEYVHKVGQRETTSDIARLYGVRKLDLLEINGLDLGDSVTWGQTIKIPAMRVIRKREYPPISIGDLLDSIIKQRGSIVANPPDNAVKKSEKKPEPQTTAEAKPPTEPIIQPAPVAKVVSVPEFSGFVWPVEGKIVREFGKVYDGIKSAGINIVAPAGTSVSSAEGGEVAYVGSGIRGMGNMILVRHDNGYISVYSHLESMLVAKGDRVEKGDMIGTVGETGQVDTAQLHFEIRDGKTPVDPNTVLGS